MARDLALAALVALVAIAAGWFFLLRNGEDAAPAPAPLPSEETRIRLFCATCHLFPDPAILPRSVWDHEIDVMYELAGAAAEPITGIPPIERVRWYFKNRAPDALPPPVTYVDAAPGPLGFTRHAVAGGTLPAVSFLKWDRDRLLSCDMRSGVVAEHRRGKPDRALARLSHPAHVEVVDLDGDGVRDLLVAELGSFLPSDGEEGKVIWLRGRADGTHEAVTLLEKVGRVADVQAGDLDGDGDLDLAVAVFGWRRTGQVLLLRNDGAQNFAAEQIDHRPGAIHVPLVDLNGDGRLDIVVVLAQQFETVEVFLNDGKDWFFKKTLFEAPHPDYGSAGIDVADLDGDGDLDVVLVCGDTLDNNVVLKPTQGVYFLENRGEYPFHVRKLASLVGAHRARVADLDGDGDLDVAASGFVPQLKEPGAPAVPPLDSVLWIEQTAPGRFAPHPLEKNACDHPSLEVGDFDGDGRIDIVVGGFYMEGPPAGADGLIFFTNAGKR